MRVSRTWGEFRQRLPVGEWPDIRRQLADPDDDPDDDARVRWEDDDAPFTQDQIPGQDTGDYPPVRSEWLGDADDFPDALTRAYHEVVLASPYRAIHWQIPEECADSVAMTLRQWGHVVEPTEFLEFC